MATFTLQGTFGASYAGTETVTLSVDSGTISPGSTTVSALQTGVSVTANVGATITATITSGTCNGSSANIVVNLVTPTPTATPPGFTWTPTPTPTAATPTPTPTPATPTPTPVGPTPTPTITPPPSVYTYYITQPGQNFDNNVCPITTSLAIYTQQELNPPNAMLWYTSPQAFVPGDTGSYGFDGQGLYYGISTASGVLPDDNVRYVTGYGTTNSWGSCIPDSYQYYVTSEQSSTGSACGVSASNAVWVDRLDSWNDFEIPANDEYTTLYTDQRLTTPYTITSGSYLGLSDVNGSSPLITLLYPNGTDSTGSFEGRCFGTSPSEEIYVPNGWSSTQPNGYVNSTTACANWETDNNLLQVDIRKFSGGTEDYPEVGDLITFGAGAQRLGSGSFGDYLGDPATTKGYFITNAEGIVTEVEWCPSEVTATPTPTPTATPTINTYQFQACGEPGSSNFFFNYQGTINVSESVFRPGFYDSSNPDGVCGYMEAQLTYEPAVSLYTGSVYTDCADCAGNNFTPTPTPTATPTPTPTPTPEIFTYQAEVCAGQYAGENRFFNSSGSFATGSSVYITDGSGPVDDTSFCVEVTHILSYNFAVSGYPLSATEFADCNACEAVNMTPTPTPTQPTPTPTPTPTATPTPTPTVYTYYYNGPTPYTTSGGACAGNANTAIYSFESTVIAAVAAGKSLYTDSAMTTKLSNGAGANRYWGLSDVNGDLPLFFVEYGAGDNAVQGSGVCGTFYDFNAKVVNSSWDPSDGGAGNNSTACGYTQTRAFRLLKRDGNTGAYIQADDRVYAAGATETNFIASGFYSYNDGLYDLYWTSTDSLGTVGIDETLCP